VSSGYSRSSRSSPASSRPKSLRSLALCVSGMSPSRSTASSTGIRESSSCSSPVLRRAATSTWWGSSISSSTRAAAASSRLTRISTSFSASRLDSTSAVSAACRPDSVVTACWRSPRASMSRTVSRITLLRSSIAFNYTIKLLGVTSIFLSFEFWFFLCFST
jgi:hypothetical protein